MTRYEELTHKANLCSMAALLCGLDNLHESKPLGLMYKMWKGKRDEIETMRNALTIEEATKELGDEYNRYLDEQRSRL